MRQYRDLWDPAARWGVPAHVTVLYPFLGPDDVDADTLASLIATVRSVPVFSCSFAHTEWFGEEVLWLAPEPPGQFRRLTEVVCGAFPQCQPYSGEHPDVVPHLTIAHSRTAGLATVREVEDELQRALPITARIDRALLIAGAQEPESWRVLAELPLAAEPKDCR